jgi:hypothetical protein
MLVGVVIDGDVKLLLGCCAPGVSVIVQVIFQHFTLPMKNVSQQDH